MSKYLLIESRNPFDWKEVWNDYQIVADLANAGHEVTLFLVENGVIPARKPSEIVTLTDLKNVKILVDEFSLKERGLSAEELGWGIQVAQLESVVEALAEGQKAIWL